MWSEHRGNPIKSFYSTGTCGSHPTAWNCLPKCKLDEGDEKWCPVNIT